MKTLKILAILVMVFGLIVWPAEVSKASPLGPAFTYQGRLIDANKPADGLYDLRFRLYDANVAGTQKGSTIVVSEVDVIDGYFTVGLDFGIAVFDGNDRWLEIGVRAGELNDPNKYTILRPRQQVTPTPYALYAGMLDGLHALDFATVSHNHDLRYYTEAESDLRYVNVTGDAIAGTNIWVLSVENTGTGNGIDGTGQDIAVRGTASAQTGVGVRGNTPGANGYGVYGYASGSSGTGVYGLAYASSGVNYGVYGKTNSPSGYAGYFDGDVKVTGTDKGIIFPDGSKLTTAAPGEIYFSVKRDASYDWPLNGTVRQIDFSSNSTVWDNVGGGFNQTISSFIAPVSGIYTFNGAIYFQNISEGNLIYAEIYARGRYYRGAYTRASGTFETVQVTITTHLNAGETAFLRGYVSATSPPASVYGNTTSYTFTYFSGARVF
jgi:hypothetical protein